MSRYQMVMGRNSSKRNRTKDEPDIMRWVLNLVVPLMTLFGILNLVVSGEAVEGLYKFFKNKGSPCLTLTYYLWAGLTTCKSAYTHCRPKQPDSNQVKSGLFPLILN